MQKKIYYLSLFLSLSLSLSLTPFFLFLLIIPNSVFAFGIDTTNRYAWSETSGWIDFGTTLGAVTVSDNALSGYAYGENIGWINLATVINDGTGILSGKAWSETVGWIDFAPTGGGVSINASGVFTGYAYGENIGWINFDTSKPVTTDWRPASSAPVSRSGTSSQRKASNMTTLNTPPQAPTNPLIPNTSPASQSTSSVNYIFNKNLSLWQTGNDVKQLQIFLNNHGYPVTLSGLGSKGQETTLFGKATLKALIKFQKDNNISPAEGYNN
jgi:hypothetical protein